MRKRRSRHLRLLNNTEAWHAEMGAAPDPQGNIAKRGIHTWGHFREVCLGLTQIWESWPEARRRAYAFPNPEDRR